MNQAEAVLTVAARERPALELRARTSELAESLFQSVRAQLSVPRYHAIAVGRGANFDAIDVPLSDAGWLLSQIAAVRKLPDERAKLAKLQEIVDRENPGPGGFYDDLGNAARQPHLMREKSYSEDPAFYRTPNGAFGSRAIPNLPRPWWDYAEMHFDAPLTLRYQGLDRAAKYRVRVVYAQVEAGEIRLVTDDGQLVHEGLSKPLEPLEFAIPPAATADGELTLIWTQPVGPGGAGRRCQVCEVWLLRE
jgi:hypothetical protein